jgi:hypothetical protein
MVRTGDIPAAAHQYSLGTIYDLAFGEHIGFMRGVANRVALFIAFIHASEWKVALETHDRRGHRCQAMIASTHALGQ